MRVLIVESDPALGGLWEAALKTLHHEVERVETADAAMAALRRGDVRIIVMDLALRGGSALAIADYAGFRYPQTRVVFVSGSDCFSDGSIFCHHDNVCAFLPMATRPDDLAMMVEHYARAA
ncbi:MAG: response regulator [Paracoccaceae bacterium]